MNDLYSNIIDQTKKLTPYEIERLIRELSKDKFNNSPISLYEEVNETNESACNKCGSVHVKKIGKVNGNQRYLCHDCHKTFFLTNATPFYKTRKTKGQWIHFMELMLSGVSLRKSAIMVGINLKTSFKWRHKIMKSLKNKMDNNVLEGKIEIDDTFFKKSNKGQKSKPANPLVIKRGLSNNLICYTTAISSSGAVVALRNGYGKNSIERMINNFGGKIKPGSIVYSDEEKAYIEFSKVNGFELIRYSSKLVKSDKLLKNVNSLHSMLKDMIKRCRGVSSAHLDKYVQWVSWMKQSSRISFSQKINAMFVDCCKFI